MAAQIHRKHRPARHQGRQLQLPIGGARSQPVEQDDCRPAASFRRVIEVSQFNRHRTNLTIVAYPFHKRRAIWLYITQEAQHSERRPPGIMPTFDELIDRHHDEIYRYLWRLSWSPSGNDPADTAEDLTQDTFLRAYRAFGRLRPDSNYRAWLYKIATNLARNAWRKRRWSEPRQDIGDESVAELGGLEELLLNRQQRAALQAELDRLPLKQRAAVTLRYLHQLDYVDIAAILSCSLDSARANASWGVRRLRQTLDAKEFSL